jgi:hypothetical protein
MNHRGCKLRTVNSLCNLSRPFWIVSTLFILPLVTSELQEPSFLFRGSTRRPFSSTSTTFEMAKLESPSAQRNKGPIWEVLSTKVFPSIAAENENDNNDNPLRILEVAAGCGVHTDYFALHLSTLKNKPFVWYPTDPMKDSRASIDSYIKDFTDKNNPSNTINMILQPALPLTLNEEGIVEAETAAALQTRPLDLIICINMIHISPWQATLGLMKVAGEQLSKDGGCLYCYGPYKVGGTTAESNL